ncbi:hypothetical protein [Streptomyces sp. NBC_01361]|uniref:hypothetical protein n=1 Tax=Streptomyces sp. NBC_01361 TaxID=2903838 RepID=UPI002E336F24|nr:hypothetical protein [Streptomyces sp. NBC_01361]
MSLPESLIVLLLLVATLALAGAVAVVVHERPSWQAPLTAAFGTVSLVVMVLGVLVAAR